MVHQLEEERRAVTADASPQMQLGLGLEQRLIFSCSSNRRLRRPFDISHGRYIESSNLSMHVEYLSWCQFSIPLSPAVLRSICEVDSSPTASPPARLVISGTKVVGSGIGSNH